MVKKIPNAFKKALIFLRAFLIMLNSGGGGGNRTRVRK